MDDGMAVRVDVSVPRVAQQVRAALAAQGFGVLTEIDVQATLRAKLGEQIEPYLILGACHPGLAHQALEVDRRIGLLLPCNVVVRADGQFTVVEALDPQVMVSVPERADLRAQAENAGTRRHGVVRRCCPRRLLRSRPAGH
jgi:uncharacterized protein (DUF302 family)